MRRRLIVVLAAVALMFTLSGPLAASAEPNDAPDAGDVGALAWNCTNGSAPSEDDSGGRDVWGRCENSNGEWFGATFYAYGEIVWVCDYFPNGYRTHARLNVSGYPERVLESQGTSNCTKHNLSYPEGLSVMIVVCSSYTSGAKCSQGVGGRT